MAKGRKNNPGGDHIAIAIVAALLGLLLIINAAEVAQPLKTADIVIAGAFLLTAIMTSLKTEE